MPKSNRPAQPITDPDDKANRLRASIDPTGYQWEEKGVVLMLEQMTSEELRRALGQSIDTLRAFEQHGLEFQSPFDAWKDDSGQYVWMERGSMHDVADLSRSDLIQAHCQVMDLVEEIDAKLGWLSRIMDAWRKGQPVPTPEPTEADTAAA